MKIPESEINSVKTGNNRARKENPSMSTGKAIWSKKEYHTTGAESTPFIFKGKEYYLLNLSPRHEDMEKSIPEHAVIVDAETGKWGSKRVFENYYFISAYSDPCSDRVFCFASKVENGWRSHRIDLIYSDDLENWSEPVIALQDYPGYVYNTGVTFDGERYVMFLEVRDQGKAFGAKFLESKDLIHWKMIEGAAFYNTVSYLGAGAIYYTPEDKYFYITYLDEKVAEDGTLHYMTNIARSHDLFKWERGKCPILEPDYTHEVLNHKGIFEINASDAEFLEVNGKVRAHACGGNQLGAHDWYTCEYDGPMQELFSSFFQ